MYPTILPFLARKSYWGTLVNNRSPLIPDSISTIFFELDSLTLEDIAMAYTNPVLELKDYRLRIK